jgi:hypothetical protein
MQRKSGMALSFAPSLREHLYLSAAGAIVTVVASDEPKRKPLPTKTQAPRGLRRKVGETLTSIMPAVSGHGHVDQTI